MHSSDQVHALSIDLCKNRYRKTACHLCLQVRVGACLSHVRACPRGLAAWGAGRPVGPGIGGACLRKGGFFEGLDSLERMWICYYY